jgi:hypothetical protein
VRIVDDENWPESDKTRTFTIRQTARLDPWHRQVSLSQFNECVGGEVRVEIDLRLQLANDNTTVRISGEARLYEGTSCNTRDREDAESLDGEIPPGRSSRTINLRNSGAGGGDKADYSGPRNLALAQVA